jgi:hypothetical protein
MSIQPRPIFIAARARLGDYLANNEVYIRLATHFIIPLTLLPGHSANLCDTQFVDFLRLFFTRVYLILLFRLILLSPEAQPLPQVTMTLGYHTCPFLDDLSGWYIDISPN